MFWEAAQPCISTQPHPRKRLSLSFVDANQMEIMIMVVHFRMVWSTLGSEEQ